MLNFNLLKMNELYHKHCFNIETITPVSVGSGATISPYSDFFLRNGKAYYVNQQRIERRLEKEPHLIDKYVSEIKRGMNNNLSDFDLYDFLEEELNIDTSTFANINVFGYQFGNEQVDKKHEVNQLIREAGKPYIPGSTLKGAIRNAMLYDWLVNTKEGQNQLNILCDEVLIFSKLPSYESWASYRNDGINKKHPDWHKYLSLDEKLKEKLKELKKKTFNEARFFGNILRKNDSQLFSSDFIVRDTQSFETSDIAIYAAARVRRFDLKDNGDDGEIPLACEAILPQRETSFDFLINKKQAFTNSHLSYLAQHDSALLLKQLNHFSRAVIEHEIDSFNLAKTIGFEKEIKALLDFYTRLKERNNKNEYFLRIGASKTFFDNVLVLALLNYKGRNKEQIREIYKHYSVIFGLQSRYPVTRTVTKIGTLPFGWVKISV